jgi:hypothetical protein
MFMGWQAFAFVAIALQVVCYFIGRHWSNVITKINKIQQLLQGENEFLDEETQDPTSFNRSLLSGRTAEEFSMGESPNQSPSKLLP